MLVGDIPYITRLKYHLPSLGKMCSSSSGYVTMCHLDLCLWVKVGLPPWSIIKFKKALNYLLSLSITFIQSRYLTKIFSNMKCLYPEKSVTCHWNVQGIVICVFEEGLSKRLLELSQEFRLKYLCIFYLYHYWDASLLTTFIKPKVWETQILGRDIAALRDGGHSS